MPSAALRTPLLIAAAFAVWLAMLLLGGELWWVDAGILAALYAGDRPLLAAAAALLTEFGGWALLVPVALAAALWLGVRGQPRQALLLLAITFMGRLLVILQKDWAARARPDELDRLVAVHSQSFPSGHAANSTIVYLTIALLLFPRTAYVATALAFAFLIGLTRVLLGVHWPSDVLGGWAFGLAWTLCLLRLAGAAGTGGAPASLKGAKETIMSNEKDRSSERAETARRHDDSELIDRMDDAPSQGDRSGHIIGQNVGTQDELKQAVGEGGVTRVRAEDKPAEANLPRFNEGNKKLNP